MSVSRDKPRHITVLPGVESVVREVATQSGNLYEIV